MSVACAEFNQRNLHKLFDKLKFDNELAEFLRIDVELTSFKHTSFTFTHFCFNAFCFGKHVCAVPLLFLAFGVPPGFFTFFDFVTIMKPFDDTFYNIKVHDNNFNFQNKRCFPVPFPV